MAERVMSVKRMETYLNSLADDDVAGNVANIVSCPVALAALSVDHVEHVSVGADSIAFTRNGRGRYYTLPNVLVRFIKLVDAEQRGTVVRAYRAKALLRQAKRPAKEFVFHVICAGENRHNEQIFMARI